MEEIKIENISSTECKILIEIPAEKVDVKLDEFLETIKKQAQVPGFRPGTAPIKVLKQHFGVKARPMIANALLNDSYERVIKDGQVSPVGAPDIKDFDPKVDQYPGKFGFDGSYKVEMTIEVLPKIDPTGYVGMELNQSGVDETKLFNDKMDEYREQFAERRQIIDRGAQLGDAVVIDFAGYVDNTLFEGGSAQAVPLNKLGASNFIPGFEEQLVGMKPEETKRITVTFPANYQAKHLAGKEAMFDITMRSIVEAKLAEVNADLALMAGFNSMDEMVLGVKAEVDNKKQLSLRQSAEGQIVTKLVELNKFDIPKVLLDEEFKSLVKRVNQPENEMNDTMTGHIKQAAEYNVRKAMLFDAIYEKEQTLEITPDELDAALTEYSKTANKTKDELISALYNSNQMDNFVGVLRTNKVVDFIINNAK